MSFFKRIFRSSNKDEKKYEVFKEGDVFYTEREGKYHTHKVLRIELSNNTCHVMAYDVIAVIPNKNNLSKLSVFVHHMPMSMDAFSNPKFIVNLEVKESDLLGYFEYIKQIHNVDEIVNYANKYYQQAHTLSSQKNHLGAIHKYSSAIELMPNFYEAIDNRAFSYMDMGKWTEAIEGFNQSLRVYPDSLLATFSIGECLCKLKQYSEARIYFEKAIQIDPSYPKSQEFLTMINKFTKE